MLFNFPVEEVHKILKEHGKSLFGWISPELPEDLMFYNDHQCLLATCSHEDFYMVDDSVWNIL